MLAALIPYRGRPPIGGHRRHRTITRPSSTRPPSAGHQVHVDHEARHHQERRHEVHVPSGPPASHHASHHATGRHQDKRRHGQRPRCATEAPRASQRVRPSAGPPAAIFTWRSAATISKSRVRTTTRPSGCHQDRATAGGQVSRHHRPAMRHRAAYLGGGGHQVHESASQTREATRRTGLARSACA